MATSGTVATYNFGVRKIIDHAARRAKIRPQRLGSEALQIAQDLLFLQLSEWAAVGFPLWTKQYSLLPITAGSGDAASPAGTVEVLNTYWRILMPWRGLAQDQNGNGVGVLFAGQPNPDVTILGPNPSVIVNFGSPGELDTIGVLLGGTVPITAALSVLTSPDGITYTPTAPLPSATYTPGQWTYFDLDPSLTAQFVMLQYPSAGPWVLNQLNFGLANGQDIPNGPLNIDDYYNLPNRSFQDDRVNSCYVDRTYQFPTLRLWPVPNISAFYNGTVTCLSRRYIQDPGKLTDTLEVPIRGYEAVVSRLATRMLKEIDDSMLTGSSDQSGIGGYLQLQQRQQLVQALEADATKAEAIFWAEERTRGPIRLQLNFGCYTT